MFVLVFSIEDIDSYVQIKQLCEQIRELKKNKHESRNNNSNVPILIVCNKLDLLLDNKINNRCVNLTDAQQFASSLKSCIYSEVSCKNRIGMDSAFEKLFIQANLPIEMLPSKHRRVSLNLDLTKPQFTKQSFQPQMSNPSEGNGSSSPNGVMNEKLKYLNKDENLTLAGKKESNFTKNSLCVESEGSFKVSAKKSFRKMTFRRPLTEACGAVWLNARRPSIRAELKLLQLKTNGNLIYHQTVDHLNNSGLRNQNYSRVQFLIQSFRKLFCCYANFNPQRQNYINNKKELSLFCCKRQ